MIKEVEITNFRNVRINEIIELANNLKFKFKFKNTLELAKLLNIQVGETNLRHDVYPAYTINFGNNPNIFLNSVYGNRSKNVLCAHELGHALLHTNNCYNQFGDNRNDLTEYEANLFAVALLFNENDFNVKFNKLDNYMLKSILDYNIKVGE